MKQPKYVVITPVRDEIQHIERTIAAVQAQTILPALWIVVDDGSTDGTSEVLDRHAASVEWMRVVHRADRGRRVNGGGVMEAFYTGFAEIGEIEWDFLVKLDGDLSFEADYFERCFAMFDADETLGIGGGTICQLESGRPVVDAKGDPAFHVRGATKIYRRSCWNAIAPLVKAAGWDTIDEVKANFHGWTTRTFPGLILIQHKPTGGADGAWRNLFKNGRANYASGYHPAFMAAKCVKRAFDPPLLVGAIALASGFITGYLKRLPRSAEPQIVRYLRRQQLRRMLNRPSIYA